MIVAMIMCGGMRVIMPNIVQSNCGLCIGTNFRLTQLHVIGAHLQMRKIEKKNKKKIFYSFFFFLKNQKKNYLKSQGKKNEQPFQN